MAPYQKCPHPNRALFVSIITASAWARPGVLSVTRGHGRTCGHRAVPSLPQGCEESTTLHHPIPVQHRQPRWEAVAQSCPRRAERTVPLALSGCCGMGWAGMGCGASPRRRPGRKGSVWLRSAEAGTPGLPGAGKASHGPCGGLCVRTAPASFRGARGAAAARAGAAPGGSAGLGSRIAPQAPPGHTGPSAARESGARPGEERSRAPGESPAAPPPPAPLAWLGSVARKTWQAMGESGLSGCALIR